MHLKVHSFFLFINISANVFEDIIKNNTLGRYEFMFRFLSFICCAVLLISNIVHAQIADFSKSENRTFYHDYVQDLSRPNTFRNTQGKEFIEQEPINPQTFGQQSGFSPTYRTSCQFGICLPSRQDYQDRNRRY